MALFADCDESPHAGPLGSNLLPTIVSAFRISPVTRIMCYQGPAGDLIENAEM